MKCPNHADESMAPQATKLLGARSYCGECHAFLTRELGEKTSAMMTMFPPRPDWSRPGDAT